MKAVVLPGVNQTLEYRTDHPEPGPPANQGIGQGGGTTIEVTACGVCHSDLHVVEGLFPCDFPFVLGHEVTGVHAELGPVMLYAPWGCRDCEQCGDGLEMICSDSKEAGLISPGGYAERMWVPDKSYLAPLDGLDPIASAPLACGGLTAYRAVKHGLSELQRRGSKSRAVVIGAGGLGQYALRYLRLMSDANVTAIDLSVAKHVTALASGAHEAVLPGAEIEKADVVIDFIGSEATLAQAASLVKKQGRVLVVGLFLGRIPFGFGAVPHEAQFMSSLWGGRHELDELLDLARNESILQPTETMPLAEAQQAHDRLKKGDLQGRIVLTT